MTKASRSIRLAALVGALIVVSAPAAPAFAQGQTRTLEDLVGEYRAQCGKNGSRERLLVAFDRAIRATRNRMRIKLLQRRRALVANPQAPVCPEPLRPAPLPAPQPAPVPAPDVPPGTDTVEDACNRPVPAAECKRLQKILGRWTARRLGGVIELVLTPDGTLSGTIVAGNKSMGEYGYSAGMQIFRGYRCRANNLSWPVLCQGGQMLMTAQPNNKYREPYSIQRWEKGGLIVLNKGTPEVLGHPLDARLANYAAWVRAGGQ